MNALLLKVQEVLQDEEARLVYFRRKNFLIRFKNGKLKIIGKYRPTLVASCALKFEIAESLYY